MEMTHAEVRRLKAKMATAATPVEAVAAWIDGRIDLAFNDNVEPELRRAPLETPSTMLNSDAQLRGAGLARLHRHPRAARRATRAGPGDRRSAASFRRSPPGRSTAWSGRAPDNSGPQWAPGHAKRAEVRDRAIRFCLRGLGVAPETIEEITDDPAAD